MADFYATPVEDEQYFLNNDQTAGWWRWLMGNNEGGVAPREKYAQGQGNRLYGMYSSDAAKDPNLGWYDWLQQSAPNLDNEYQSQAPQARGDYTSALTSPRGRWVNAQ